LITAPNSLLNILIVEDNFSFATELRMLIRNLGYNCAGVIETGEKALLEIQKNTPDAIIMDITLSGELSGLDVAEKIKNEKIPILIITSFNDEMTYLRASKLDMIGFLVKPLNEYTLRDKSSSSS